MTEELILKIVIVACVIVVGGGGVIFAKKYGTTFISIAASLVAFIKLKMDECDLGSDVFDTVMDLIIQSLSYIQAMSSETTDIDEKVESAYSFIENLLKEAKINVSDSETIIIKSILKGGFEFMKLLGIGADKVNMKNYLKLYKRMAAYVGPNVKVAVGLRKSI